MRVSPFRGPFAAFTNSLPRLSAPVLKILVCGALASCASGWAAHSETPGWDLPEQLKTGEPYQLSPAELDTLKATITARLINPDSVKFGNARAARQKNGDVLICIESNAKNRFGGYVGFEADWLFIHDGKIGFTPHYGGLRCPMNLFRKARHDGR